MVEVFFIRFLYTNVWANVGLAYDDFWTHLLKVFNSCLTLWVAAVTIVSNNWSYKLDLAICMGKDVHLMEDILDNRLKRQGNKFIDNEII